MYVAPEPSSNESVPTPEKIPAVVAVARETAYQDDERRVVAESLLAIRRAGADVIITYYAKEVAGWGPLA